jgi:hypothetical protein
MATNVSMRVYVYSAGPRSGHVCQIVSVTESTADSEDAILSAYGDDVYLWGEGTADELLAIARDHAELPGARHAEQRLTARDVIRELAD